jgi:hypothetical protein
MPGRHRPAAGAAVPATRPTSPRQLVLPVLSDPTDRQQRRRQARGCRLVRPIRQRSRPYFGSRAHTQHTTVHSRHENSSDPGRTTRSEPMLCGTIRCRFLLSRNGVRSHNVPRGAGLCRPVPELPSTHRSHIGPVTRGPIDHCQLRRPASTFGAIPVGTRSGRLITRQPLRRLACCTRCASTRTTCRPKPRPPVARVRDATLVLGTGLGGPVGRRASGRRTAVLIRAGGGGWLPGPGDNPALTVDEPAPGSCSVVDIQTLSLPIR